MPSKRKREASEDGLGHKVCRPKRGETLLQDAHLWILLALLLGARTLLGAKGIATRSDRTLLGAPGLTTRSKDATNGAPGIAARSILTSNKKLFNKNDFLI